MRILLSSIGVQSGTDLQLALYYLKSYLLKRKNAAKPLPEVKIKVFHKKSGKRNPNLSDFPVISGILKKYSGSAEE
jgi:hypothetical protein